MLSNISLTLGAKMSRLNQTIIKPIIDNKAILDIFLKYSIPTIPPKTPRYKEREDDKINTYKNNGIKPIR
jgi:hypothetical protein